MTAERPKQITEAIGMYIATAMRPYELSTASAVPLTTDGWTSRATESYLAVTHFINSEWEMQNPVLLTHQHKLITHVIHCS